ncbi:ATP-binding protein [Roseateles asaccharophilus]|uniref:SpoVK/Ycf46/Vps4 family AAA+-type ATPase n=1 Tax=Roseateles asaccharophilus TaxID=582607 RepID=A0ABU2ACJ2_9BURK|nr:ATP-binding protein [Roseateles asaccharophilus]MDR7334927.1 SpoVK/Ycf46/Vps4 family AAA+-type ATPase [Roseateles asaccharophilus]
MPKVSKIALQLEDVALPASSIAQLRKIATESAGTVILTAPPGAQRTQAAESLARTMGCALVRVDLAQVVSRFIGETEKNLDLVFAEAAASSAALFFDEADALFGKRSGVKDSHDRYANVDVAYLLQKIGAHSGVVVLASSGRKNIDPAFLRRLRYVVDLPWPPKVG